MNQFEKPLEDLEENRESDENLLARAGEIIRRALCASDENTSENREILEDLERLLDVLDKRKQEKENRLENQEDVALYAFAKLEHVERHGGPVTSKGWDEKLSLLKDLRKAVSLHPDIGERLGITLEGVNQRLEDFYVERIVGLAKEVEDLLRLPSDQRLPFREGNVPMASPAIIARARLLDIRLLFLNAKELGLKVEVNALEQKGALGNWDEYISGLGNRAQEKIDEEVMRRQKEAAEKKGRLA